MSVLDDFSAKQEGFRLGIDDYMVKIMDDVRGTETGITPRGTVTVESELGMGATFTVSLKM